MLAETSRDTLYGMDNWMPEIPSWETCIISQSTISHISDPGSAIQDPSEMQASDPGPAAASKRKRSARKCNCAVLTPTSTRPSENPWNLCALLRRVFFINSENSRYVSVGFYPAHDYQVLVELGGSRSQAITLTTQHLKTLVEHLPEFYDTVTSAKLLLQRW
jgi:hypothetical protein